jgi:hypothetical protein
LFQITVGMQTERVDRNRAMSSLGVSNVWYLYRLSTRTNQRAVYFFCQKYYKPRHYAKTLFTEKRTKQHYSPNFRSLSFIKEQNWNTAKFGNTLFTEIPWTLFTNRKIIRQLRISFFSQPKHYLGEKPRKRENRLPNRSDNPIRNELVIFSLLSTSIYRHIGRLPNDQNALGLHKITYMPLSG